MNGFLKGMCENKMQTVEGNEHNSPRCEAANRIRKENQNCKKPKDKIQELGQEPKQQTSPTEQVWKRETQELMTEKMATSDKKRC